MGSVSDNRTAGSLAIFFAAVILVGTIGGLMQLYLDVDHLEIALRAVVEQNDDFAFGVSINIANRDIDEVNGLAKLNCGAQR